MQKCSLAKKLGKYNDAKSYVITKGNDSYEKEASSRHLATIQLNESNKDSEQINNTSNSITSYKHVIQKLSESSNEISLPISNVEHDAIISFVSDAMSFLTSLEVNTNIDPEEKLKLSRMYTLVQAPNENLINEIRNYKITTDKVEVMITNLHILQNFSDVTDTSVDGNVSLDPTLDL
ncbi:uncharacterized protein LOC130678547 [Microplitis mediator]|uniref:uncharacterized protein LOC130678547 n=1 Tax=Microplitis mediator TaxID=375433 RepID=UPI0025577D9F|nr:uncharacterized protein LOC130678547 [Microplitis mediator]